MPSERSLKGNQGACPLHSMTPMQEVRCPLCFGPLEVRNVAPGDECGGSPVEIEHFQQRRHTFRKYEIFQPLRLIFCNFCDVDFASFDPTFFGLPQKSEDWLPVFRGH